MDGEYDVNVLPLCKSSTTVTSVSSSGDTSDGETTSGSDREATTVSNGATTPGGDGATTAAKNIGTVSGGNTTASSSSAKLTSNMILQVYHLFFITVILVLLFPGF